MLRELLRALTNCREIDPLIPVIELIEQLSTRSPDSVAASKKLLNQTRRSRPRRAFHVDKRETLSAQRKGPLNCLFVGGGGRI